MLERWNDLPRYERAVTVLIALCLLVASDRFLDLSGMVRDHTVPIEIDAVKDRVKRSIGSEGFLEISDASSRLSIDEAVAYALGERELPWVTSDA